MARYTGPKHKLARREGINLLDKTSASLQRRLMVPPGVHGRKMHRRLSEYGQQLREKQKAKALYGILERQFRRMVDDVSKQKGDTGELLLGLLETRLDNVVYRLGLAKSRFHSRQLVSHGHVKVDGKRLNIPSYHVQVGEVVSLDEKTLQNVHVLAAQEEETIVLPFLSKEASMGKLTRMPQRTDVDVPFNTQQIIEYYSR